MNTGEEYLISVEKLAFRGLGLAKINNFVVFIENACPQDELKILITRVTKNYAQAKILEIIKPSPHRIEPFCPMQKICGACQLQFIDYDYQLELKHQTVEDALHSTAGIDLKIPTPEKSPEIKNYRHKIQYPVSQTKNSKRILAGYYKQNSHEIVNIKYCPIQPKICDKIIDFIRNETQTLGICAYDEKKHRGELRHIVIRNSAYNGKNLVALVINSKNGAISENLKKLCENIYGNFEEVSGVCINFNSAKSNVILGDKTVCVCGKSYIEEKLLDKIFKIGTETFFQVNPKSAENIFKYVKNYIAENFDKPTVLDAYAGIGTFGICVSDVSSFVVSVEQNKESVKLAKESAELNNVQNIEIISDDFASFIKNEKRMFDVVIIDPPRKGSDEESLSKLCKICKDTLIYVSCDPVTLARDLKFLLKNGCEVISVKPFDMFCHTYHIENVAIIKMKTK